MHNVFKQRPLVFGLVATSLVAGGSFYAWRQDAYRQQPNINTALDSYGFKTPTQKEALRFLMQKSGVKNTDTFFNTSPVTSNVLSKTILEFVKETQDKFTIRTGVQERWDIKTSAWMQDTAEQPEILEALERLNMIDAVAPTFKERDVICILGGSKILMVSRLDYASDLFVGNKLPSSRLVLLAGERYVTADKNGVSIDGSEQELSAIAGKLGKDITQLTETDLIRAVYQASQLYNKLPTVVIDTPKRDLPRPTTETTVTELCDWLKKNPEIKSITFVSNQPHVDYQKAIIAQVFEKQGMHIKFEVIGSQYNPPVVSSADKINYVLQALGSRIWASTPEVINALALDMSDPELRAEYMALYKKLPLIYNNLDAKFSKPKLLKVN